MVVAKCFPWKCSDVAQFCFTGIFVFFVLLDKLLSELVLVYSGCGNLFNIFRLCSWAVKFWFA